MLRRGSLLIATDFDGTLAPVVRDPTRARPLPQARRALATLARRTTVAVISGRDLANLASQCRIPGVLLLGSYGLEPWRQVAAHEAPPPPPEPSPQMLELGHALQQLTSWMDGVQVEVKSLGVAVHYRNAPDPRRVGPIIRRLMEQLSARQSFQVLRGRLVVEARPPRSGNKGTALAMLLDRLQPKGCIFAGDDLGDVPAMRVLHSRRDQLELAEAVGVVSSESYPELLDEADYLLDGPARWAELLSALVDGLEQPAPAPA